MDHSLEEAALDLGASEWQVFRDVILPQILPAILSGVLLAFAMSFDDVVISIFVTGPKVNTLPVKIYTKLKTGVTPEINALPPPPPPPPPPRLAGVYSHNHHGKIEADAENLHRRRRLCRKSWQCCWQRLC